MTFDPTYATMTRGNGYSSDQGATTYLDIYPAGTDDGYCAPGGIFWARNGYLPVWGFETNVANDYGWIPLRQDGFCSYSPDTGLAWDFQVPCKAHDYCYDLRKAGFSASATDNACDNAFDSLMEAHCNNRVLIDDCRIVRFTMYSFVSANDVATNPDPAAVTIRPLHSGKCAES